MRVLYITGSYRPDSMVSHTHGDLVAALRGRGVDAEIATFAAPDHAEAISVVTDRHGTRVWRVRPRMPHLNRAYRMWGERVWAFPPFSGLVAGLRSFLTAERVAEYDLLHVGMAFPYATAVRHALRSRALPPTIVTITGGDILTNDETGYGYGKHPIARRSITRTLRWAAMVQANSPLTAAAVARHGCPPERIVVQPPLSSHEALPADAIDPYRRAACREIEQTAAIPPGRLLLGLGRMVPIKGYDDVIRALPAVLAVCPNVTALFAGPARDARAQEYVTSLRRLAAELGVAGHVRIEPQIAFPDVARYFAATDIALIPSLLDGINMTGVEAASVGTPSVVSTAAGLAHYVETFHAGELVPPRSPSALATAILRLLTSDEAWSAASRGAHAMAQSFSLDNTAGGVLRLYRRLAPDKAPQSRVLYSDADRRSIGGDDG